MQPVTRRETLLPLDRKETVERLDLSMKTTSPHLASMEPRLDAKETTSPTRSLQQATQTTRLIWTVSYFYFFNGIVDSDSFIVLLFLVKIATANTLSVNSPQISFSPVGSDKTKIRSSELCLKNNVEYQNLVIELRSHF